MLKSEWNIYYQRPIKKIQNNKNTTKQLAIRISIYLFQLKCSCGIPQSKPNICNKTSIGQAFRILRFCFLYTYSLYSIQQEIANTIDRSMIDDNEDTTIKPNWKQNTALYMHIFMRELLVDICRKHKLLIQFQSE